MQTKKRLKRLPKKRTTDIFARAELRPGRMLLGDFMAEKILVTCFEPFGGEVINASAEVARYLPESIGGMDALKLVLPVEFGRGASIALEAAKNAQAKVIVCFGEARSRSAVTPELVAINLNYASIPDNAGANPMDEPINKDGAAAYFTSFPARKLAERIKENGVQSALSYSAGAYVCNDLYYRLLEALGGSGVDVLFIHVPRAAEDNGYERMADAIFSSLDSILQEKREKI